MKLDEFLERGLLISCSGRIYDEDCNEYRDEDGMHFLEENEEIITSILHRQLRENRGSYLIELE